MHHTKDSSVYIKGAEWIETYSKIKLFFVWTYLGNKAKEKCNKYNTSSYYSKIDNHVIQKTIDFKYVLTTGEIFNDLNLLSHFYFILVNYYYNDNTVTKYFIYIRKPNLHTLQVYCD